LAGEHILTTRLPGCMLGFQSTSKKTHYSH